MRPMSAGVLHACHQFFTIVKGLVFRGGVIFPGSVFSGLDWVFGLFGIGGIDDASPLRCQVVESA
jgi:hypothetical protein